MDQSRIRGAHAPDEVAPNTWRDFEWAREHEKELLAEYGACVILVYNQQIIGKGKSVQEATEDAEQHLPPDIQEATPITYFLHQRRLFASRV